jgi:predicted TIM-barrel fold metal-dependent hydrolase
MSNRVAAATNDGVLSLVDAHQHFQDIGAHYYPWLSDRDRPPQLEGDLNPIRRDYLPSDYAADIAGADVRKTVHVENGWDPADPVGETRWLQGLAEKLGRPSLASVRP